MPIPQGTRQAVGLRDIAERVGIKLSTARSWWKTGLLVGKMSEGDARARVVIPVEVLDYYLRYFRLPTKLELFRCGALSRDFLLELGGPDGGLSELEDEVAARGVVNSGVVIPSGRVSKTSCAP